MVYEGSVQILVAIRIFWLILDSLPFTVGGSTILSRGLRSLYYCYDYCNFLTLSAQFRRVKY